jgi:hypothetical protein
MRFTSPSRRALGVVAASTIGMSTALLGVTGIASAAPTPTWTFSGSSPSVVVPAGICAIDVDMVGGAGGADSDTGPGGAGGHLVAEGISVQAGETLHLFVGAAGGNASSTEVGAGGVSGDPDFAGEDGYDNVPDGFYGGGGGSSSAIVAVGEDGEYVIAEAFGGDGSDAGFGGAGAGFGYNDADTDVTFDDEATSTGAPSISGTGVACVADAPYVNYVAPGNGSATVNFVPQSDNGIPVTRWEYSVDDGDTWATLSTTPDRSGFEGTITGLVNEQTYAVSVRAAGGTGDELKGEASESQEVTPYVPLAAPTNVSVTTTTSRVTISWTAVPGQVKGYDVGWFAGQMGDQGCATAPTVTTCSFNVPAGSGYEIGVRAIDMQDRPGVYASQTGITVPGPATPSAVPTQDNGDITGPAGPISKITAGQKITLQGTGFAPNSTVQLLVYSSPVSLGTVVTDENGSFSVEVTVPANLANGTHHLVATGVDANGNVRNLVIAVTVSGGVATLATTGFDAVPVAVGGGLVLLTGAGLLVGARRRSNV